MKLTAKIFGVLAIACVPLTLFGQSADSGASPSPVPTAALERADLVSRDARVTRAESEPGVRAAAAKLRAALEALRAVMLAKDGFIGPVFEKFEAGEILSAGVKAPVFSASELGRLGAGFKAVQGTPELYAYVRAKHAYREALRRAMAVAAK